MKHLPLLLCLTLAASVPFVPATAATAAIAPASPAVAESARLHDLFDREW